jgi:hypothetical protein
MEIAKKCSPSSFGNGKIFGARRRGDPHHLDLVLLPLFFFKNTESGSMLSHFRELSHSLLLQCSSILATLFSHFSLSNNAQLFLLQCPAILMNSAILQATVLNHFALSYIAQPFFHCYSTHASSLLHRSIIFTATVLSHSLFGTLLSRSSLLQCALPLNHFVN